MATTVDFMNYICEQISGAWEIRYKKMFGEYMVYVNDKPILLVCDNTVFVKQIDCVKAVLENAEKGIPYKSAKEHYILDIDNAELSREVASILEENTAVPKPRKKKK